jgi:Ni/Fe-hydrogenase subunit HybB-like protein
MEERKALGGKLLTKPFWVLLALAMVAGLLLLKRFLLGIGAVTNLSDGYPWGLWIVYDVLAGTALACGGYSVALLGMRWGSSGHPYFSTESFTRTRQSSALFTRLDRLKFSRLSISCIRKRS